MRKTFFLVSIAALLIGVIFPVNTFATLNEGYFFSSFMVTIANIFLTIAVIRWKSRIPPFMGSGLNLVVSVLMVIFWILFVVFFLISIFGVIHLGNFKFDMRAIYFSSLIVTGTFIFLILMCLFDACDQRNKKAS